MRAGAQSKGRELLSEVFGLETGLTLVSQGPLKHELPIEAPLPHQEPNFWTHSRVGQPDCGLPIPRKDPYCWAESRSPEKGADVRC